MCIIVIFSIMDVKYLDNGFFEYGCLRCSVQFSGNSLAHFTLCRSSGYANYSDILLCFVDTGPALCDLQ